MWRRLAKKSHQMKVVFRRFGLPLFLNKKTKKRVDALFFFLIYFLYVNLSTFLSLFLSFFCFESGHFFYFFIYHFHYTIFLSQFQIFPSSNSDAVYRWRPAINVAHHASLPDAGDLASAFLQVMQLSKFDSCQC